MLSRRAGSLVAMVAACGLAGSGLALATDDFKEPVRAFDDAPTAMTESISEEQRGFALLRRAQDSGDVMPAWVAAQIGNPDFGGKNVKLARAFATPTGKGWVIPGNDAICIAAPDPAAPADDPSFGLSCNSTSWARDHGLAVLLVDPQTKTGVAAALVPDGGEVALREVGGSQKSVPVTGGTAAVFVRGGQSVEITTPNGAASLPVPANDDVRSVG